LIKDKNSLLPLFITLLFVAHPIHTEVIANVKSRDEILCALGGFMGLYYAFRLIHEGYLKKHFILMIIGLLISLFSKEIGLAYVVLIPITIWFFDGSIARFKKEFILAPIVLIALFFTIRLNMLETNAQLDDLSVLNNALVGIDSQMDKITTALFIQVKGLILQVFPYQLSWDYSYNQIPEVKTFSIQGILTWIALVGVIIIGFIGVKGKKIWGWVIVFYIATVFLTSNLFVLFGATMGERFFFSPSFAIVFIVGLITREIIIKKNISNKISFSLSVLLVTVFSFNAYNQKMIWESTKTIALAGISSAPQSTRTWETYASYYRELAEKSDNQKDFNQNITKAIKGYQKSTEILKSNFSALYNLGVSYAMVQKTDSALYAYQTCIQVNPKYENALNNIAVIYINARNIEPAKETVNKLLELNPVHVDGLINKGLIYHIEGDLSSAKTYYLKALKISPNHSVALKNIALIK
jgi:tetratricopeptide (TPR) repeat protein